MRMIARLGAVLLLLWGIPLSVVSIAMMNDADRETRNAGLTALVVFGFPPVAAGAGLWLWSRKASSGQGHQLKQTFFRLLQDNGGKVTVLRFAMETGLEGDEAKAYLDERAIEFNATFEATDQGAVTYVFDLGQPALPMNELEGESGDCD